MTEVESGRVGDTAGEPAALPLEIRRGTRQHDAERDALAMLHPRGSFFHLAGWRDIVQRVHGHEPHDIFAWRGSELVGFFPLAYCKRPIGSNLLISMPYAVYGGPVGIDAEVEAALVEGAKKAAKELGVGRLEVRNRLDPENDWPGSDLYVTFIRDLPSDPAEIMQLMPKKARAEARKGQKRHGLELTEGVWYVDDLARLFLANKHALGSPALPARHFHAIVDRMERKLHVHLVRNGREPLAAVMSFAFGDTLIAYYAGTAPGADRAFSVSNFMYTALQEWAVERGFKHFDFCRSRVDSGAYRFKIHQGFTPQPLHYRYFLVRDSGPPTFTPSNPRTAVLQRAWAKLPEWLVRRASDRLSAYLP